MMPSGMENSTATSHWIASSFLGIASMISVSSDIITDSYTVSTTARSVKATKEDTGASGVGRLT